MERDNKVRFGTAEVVSTIIGIICFSAMSHLAYHVDNQEMTHIFDHIKFLIIAYFAAVFGPYTGAMIGIASTVFGQFFLPQDYWIIDTIAIGTYGFIIGAYSEKYQIRYGTFNFKQASLLEFSTLFSNIVIFAFFNPLFEFLCKKTDLFDGMKAAILNATHVTIITAIVLPPICFITNLVFKKIVQR